ncbi:MAG: hypothetical protein R3284_09300, partial [Rubricoccaceae bacterium]|nr:hypothetical protein [Rubricoccaceae bacterium]
MPLPQTPEHSVEATIDTPADRSVGKSRVLDWVDGGVFSENGTTDTDISRIETEVDRSGRLLLKARLAASGEILSTSRSST